MRICALRALTFCVGLFLVWATGLAVVAAFDQTYSIINKSSRSTMMQQLIRDAKQKKRLTSSDALYDYHVAKKEVGRFKHFIETHRDYRSYHLLMALWWGSPEAYKEISVEARAAVLSSALKESLLYNDWGDLDRVWGELMNTGINSHCGPARALLEVGTPAIPYLLPILDDRRDAWLAGSEEADFSISAHYRKTDWACMFISWILKIPYKFDGDPEDRDNGIERIRNLGRAIMVMRSMPVILK